MSSYFMLSKFNYVSIPTSFPQRLSAELNRSQSNVMKIVSSMKRWVTREAFTHMCSCFSRCALSVTKISVYSSSWSALASR